MTTTAKRQRQREGRVARLEAERKAALRAARRRRIIMGVVVAALIVGLMALLAFLGNKDDKDDKTADKAAPSTTTTTAPPKPDVTIPTTPPPTTLQSTDLKPGTGQEAQTGDSVKVHYVGKVYSTGKEFDSSYKRDPIDFTLGQDGIIPGWNEGIVGMKAGGRRQLVIPPDLGYGAQGSPPDIPANATLVFVIDLIEVTKAPAGTTATSAG